MSIKVHLAFALALVSALSAGAAAPAADAKAGAAKPANVIDKDKMVNGRVELSDSFGKASDNRRKAARTVAAHERGDVCLDYAGDVLTWGQVEDYVGLQLLEAPLNIPPQATLEQVNAIVASAKVRLAEVAVNTYLREALLSPLARQAGLSVSDAELSNALDRATQKAARKKHGAEIVPKLREPHSYFNRYQKNYLLSRKYREAVLEREVEVSPEEIAACISNREEVIAAAIATNGAKRATIEGLLEKIRSGELDFGQAAYEHSDCGSSMENGDWGEFEADCNLIKPLKDFIFAPSTAEMSDVIETPFSYHIVKILERHYDGDAEAAMEEPEGEEAAKPPRGGFGPRGVTLTAILVCAVALSCGLFFFVPRQAEWRLSALWPVWGVAVLAAALAFAFLPGGRARAPTRVHVAHIMLEKEETPPPLDADAARAEARRQKLAQCTMALQEKLLETAQTNGTLKCAVRMTLLNKTKMLRKKAKEREQNHAK
ncbi:MAG: peptidylprolyl isomerase [Kiritimatiellae bacterium]|nr:peptidylprolyl isomerase [Kiritimatiellia bacterium]